MTERQQLLSEIASLEAEIASLSSEERPAKRPRLGQQQYPQPDAFEGGEGSLAESLLALLRENDSALSTGGGGGVLGGGAGRAKAVDGEPVTSEELERERELARMNADFTGIVFDETEDRIIDSTAAHQTRLHTLTGTLPSSTLPALTLGFRAVLRVREPALVLPTGPPRGRERERDPGSEYQVRGMDVEVWGGGAELDSVVRSLNLETTPNPPAFFAALRSYSLLAHRRATTFATLRTRLGRWVVDVPRIASSAHGKGKGRATEDGGGEDEDDALDSQLVLSNPARTLTLTLSYTLSPTSILSLLPALDSGLELSPTAQATIAEIPARFQEMLRDGFGVEDAVGALCEAVLGG
ncbi:hypothetical protein RQP46_010384 [Phenoliferia psychrophenolica]